MRLTDLETQVATSLDTPIYVAMCDSYERSAGLSDAEQIRHDRFNTDARRRGWLRGRLALKAVLRSLDRPEDTAAIRMPAPQLSLTHGNSIALAAGTPVEHTHIGIDVEAERSVNENIARWYLNESELGGPAPRWAGCRSSALIHLWTVKEAVFKAHPGNSGMALKDFTIADPSADVVEVQSVDGLRFQCVSLRVNVGIVSVAIQRGNNED